MMVARLGATIIAASGFMLLACTARGGGSPPAPGMEGALFSDSFDDPAVRNLTEAPVSTVYRDGAFVFLSIGDPLEARRGKLAEIPGTFRGAAAQENDRQTLEGSVDFNNLGLAQWRNGDYRAAIASLTRAIELQPEWWAPHNHRALARVAAGDAEGALADAEVSLELLGARLPSADNWAAVLDTRAYAHLAMGRYQEALTDYDAVLATNVDSHAAFALGRGLSLVGLGEERRGLADLKWGTLIAPAFGSDPQLRDLIDRTSRVLASLMAGHLPDAHEPDDSPAEANELVLDGRAELHSLHAGGDVDWVSFQLTAGQGVRLVAASTTCDTYLTLVGPDQTVLREDDDGGANGGDSMLQYAVRQTGTYYASVRHFFSAQGTCPSYELSGIATPAR